MTQTMTPRLELPSGNGHDHRPLGVYTRPRGGGGWRDWITTIDHKKIGILYGGAALFFFLVGGVEALLMRLQLATPDGTVLGADTYNQVFTMHGVTMVFLVIMPMAAAFANYLLPLQIGARDVAFPRLNALSFWLFLAGGLFLNSAWLLGGAPDGGWFGYAPNTGIIFSPGNGMDFYALGLQITGIASLVSAMNLIVTVLNMRAPGMTLFKMPVFTWMILVVQFLLLFAIPVITVALFLLLFDRNFGANFFNPQMGSDPLLWQHLFWFLAHPEVYVLVLPGMGIVCEVIANNTRKPIWGYKFLVGSIVVLGFLAFIVWAHHMYMTGMGTVISAFFQTTTLLISIPSIIILTCLFISLWGGSIRFNTPMLFALAFLPMFGIGGLTGLPLGFNFSDVALHDSYYVIAHFHYVVAPGTIFAIFAGVYYWFPKMTGRRMNERWGKVHFWSSLIFMNLIFLPLFAQGMAGMSRRMSDGGATYSLANPDNADVTVGALSDTIMGMNVSISAAAWAMLVAQLPFIINLFWSVKHGEKIESDNPWQATTLEWETPTPPPHGNFNKEIKVYRDPYEYSVPGANKDFSPQAQPAK